jgi:ketosteroid isomerase-like protein
MKYLITLGIVSLLWSCTTTNNTNQQQENLKLITTYFEYFNNHQWAEMAALYTEKAQFKDPSLGLTPITMTIDETIDKYQQLQQVFPDLQDSITATYPSGNNHIIVEFVSSGTALDGITFSLPICTIFTIENGKITKDFTYYDNFEE